MLIISVNHAKEKTFEKCVLLLPPLATENRHT